MRNWVPDCNDHFARAASVGVRQHPLELHRHPERVEETLER